MLFLQTIRDAAFESSLWLESCPCTGKLCVVRATHTQTHNASTYLYKQTIWSDSNSQWSCCLVQVGVSPNLQQWKLSVTTWCPVYYGHLYLPIPPDCASAEHALWFTLVECTGLCVHGGWVVTATEWECLPLWCSPEYCRFFQCRWCNACWVCVSISVARVSSTSCLVCYGVKGMNKEMFYL